MKKGILLIHPPTAKACEAPGGPARLAGTLRRHGVAFRIWDANLEGQKRLMKMAAQSSADPQNPGTDAWTRRSAKHLSANLSALRSGELYRNPDRYRRAVKDLSRLLATAARPFGVRLSLADYEDERLSPVRSADLLQSAAAPEGNPFYPWFRARLPMLLSEFPVSHAGFSLNYLSQALTTFAMAGFLRRTFPGIRIILGGGLVTSWMRRPGWKAPFEGLVDDLIAGPGEAPLLNLLGLDGDGRPDPPDIRAISPAD